MKTNKLFLAVFFLFAAFFLASCGRSVYIAKRQFNEGYYVHISKKIDVSAEKSSEFKHDLESSLLSAAKNKAKPVSAEVIKDSSNVKSSDSDNSFSASVNKVPTVSRTKVATVTNTGKQTSPRQQFKEEKKLNKVRNNIARIYTHQKGGDVPTVILVLLCIFLPFIAVGIVDNWGTRFLISLLLTLLFWIPGVIYAFIVCFG